jgi:hypothetical protein
MRTFSRLEFGLAAALGLFLLFLAPRGFMAPAEAARGFDPAAHGSAATVTTS